jgi:predicted amidophosphoribosyltransferase
MSKRTWRMEREKKTIRYMIMLYCRKLHGASHGICLDCEELLDYAMRRLDSCRFQESKTTCAKCRVHCYKPSMREKIRQVMRYSGPKMIYYHPFLALVHFFDGFSKQVTLKKKENEGTDC